MISACDRAAPRMLSTSRLAMTHGNAIANPKGASRRACCILCDLTGLTATMGDLREHMTMSSGWL